MKHIKLFENFKVNEELIGTILLTLGLTGIGYLVLKIRKFLSKFGKFIPMTKINLFLRKIEDIEKGEFDGKVVVKDHESRIYTIMIMQDDKVFDRITIDRYNDTIYDVSGTVLVPIQLGNKPTEFMGNKVSGEDMEKVIRESEKELMDSLVEIIKKYSK